MNKSLTNGKTKRMSISLPEGYREHLTKYFGSISGGIRVLIELHATAQENGIDLHALLDDAITPADTTE